MNHPFLLTVTVEIFKEYKQSLFWVLKLPSKISVQKTWEIPDHLMKRMSQIERITNCLWRSDKYSMYSWWTICRTEPKNVEPPFFLLDTFILSCCSVVSLYLVVSNLMPFSKISNILFIHFLYYLIWLLIILVTWIIFFFWILYLL